MTAQMIRPHTMAPTAQAATQEPCHRLWIHSPCLVTGLGMLSMAGMSEVEHPESPRANVKVAPTATAARTPGRVMGETVAQRAPGRREGYPLPEGCLRTRPRAHLAADPRLRLPHGRPHGRPMAGPWQAP